MEPPPPSRLRRWALTAAVHLTGIAVTLVALSQTALLLVFSSPLALFDPFEDCALNVLELPEKQVVAGSHHGVTTCDVVDPVTGAVLAVAQGPGPAAQHAREALRGGWCGAFGPHCSQPSTTGMSISRRRRVSWCIVLPPGRSRTTASCPVSGHTAGKRVGT